MDDESLQSRLSRIETRWSIITAEPGNGEAAALMLRRYGQAVYRYLLASLRNADAADEVYQEFGVKLVQGAFGKADPAKGRFRNYLKSAIVRLTMDEHRRRARRAAEPLGEVDPAASPLDPQEAASFDETWRGDVLRRVWSALEEDDRARGNVHAQVLRTRVENPDCKSEELAAILTKLLNKESPLSPAGARKAIHHARERYGELLLLDVAEQVETSDLDRIEEELIALGLLEYCRSSLERARRPQS